MEEDEQCFTCVSEYADQEDVYHLLLAILKADNLRDLKGFNRAHQHVEERIYATDAHDLLTVYLALMGLRPETFYTLLILKELARKFDDLGDSRKDLRM